MKARYFTHAHNIEDCLKNGSYVRQDGRRLVRYMNGDYMGEITTLPDNMTEVEASHAKALLPKCCK